MTDDIDLTPDQLAKAIERLEREKQRRAEGKPAAAEPTAVERHIMPDLDVEKFTTRTDTKDRKQPKKPRAARLTPVPFYVTTAKPSQADVAGAIS
jgi:hypothetical protein